MHNGYNKRDKAHFLFLFRLGVNAFCRAYIYFKNHDDIFVFRDRFDNYIFLDSKSNEYPAVVEFAPYQRRFKIAESQKKDPKCNTINEDSDYIKFLENFGKPSGETLPSCEAILEELEQRDKEKALKEDGKVMTPLLEFMKRKREDKKIMMREVISLYIRKQFIGQFLNYLF